MCFSLVMLFLCLSQTELADVWVQQQADDWNGVSSQQREEPTGGDSGAHRSQRSSSSQARMSRAVLGGGLTISTLPDNMTRVVEDSGKYYTWRSFGPEDQRTHDLWVDMSDVRRGQVRVHGILSNSYKQAVRVALSFDFPFYGHYLRQITIATGGFIFTGDVTHRMLTATQYIAPLMANFDPSYSKESTVQYLDNGEVFVVQWERVRLPGKEAVGAFTFQTALYKTGVIAFSYRDIPLPMDVMGSAEHPVKAGLSDAFMVTSPSPQSPDAPQQTIYEYHRVELDTTKITNYSAFEFVPLPTCLLHDNCQLCLSSKQTSGCSWCNVLQRCSDGMDRHRQEWLDYDCAEEKDKTCEEYFGDSSVTPVIEDTTSSPPLRKECDTDDDTKRIFKMGSDVKTDSSSKSEGLANNGVIAGIAAALVLILALILVALYINFHPAAVSPLYLIQRRKSYWPSLKFQKQQPGYTEVEGEGCRSLQYRGSALYDSGVCEQKDKTCEEYFGDSSVTPVIEDTTSSPPLRKECDTDDDTKRIFKMGSDVKTDSSSKSEGLANNGVIAGIAAALVLILALILVALYINFHPAAVSPLYLIQRRKSYWPSLKFQKQQPGYTEVEGEGHDKDSIVEAGPC